MSTKLSKKRLSILPAAALIVALVLACLFPVCAASAEVSAKNANLNAIVQKMNAEYGTTVSKATTKTTLDFAGNTYTVVECNPVGYAIYCDGAEEATEYSAESPSSYAGYTSSLYYGGPMQYFVKQNGLLVHTVTGESASETASAGYMSQSAALHNEMLANKSASTPATRSSSQTAGGYTFTCINNSGFFASLNTCGYVSGKCAYVAGAMIIGYCDVYVNSDYDTDGNITVNDAEQYDISSSLTNSLASIGSDLGYGSSINANKLSNVMSDYLSDHNISGVTHVSRTVFSNKNITDYIDDNYPVVAIGSMYNPDNGGHFAHAIVIYGYKSGGYGIQNGYGFLAHYGWDGYNKITVKCTNNSTFNSIYVLQY